MTQLPTEVNAPSTFIKSVGKENILTTLIAPITKALTTEDNRLNIINIPPFKMQHLKTLGRSAPKPRQGTSPLTPFAFSRRGGRTHPPICKHWVTRIVNSLFSLRCDTVDNEHFQFVSRETLFFCIGTVSF